MDPANTTLIEAHRSLGAVTVEGKTHFAVWAPDATRVAVDSDGSHYALHKQASGFHVGEISEVQTGDNYFYRVDGGPRRPDPASRYQPEGVHGPSQVISSEFDWYLDWTPPKLDDAVIYELHIGAFTEEGTFASAARRLTELVDLGINAIELMPIAASAGRWNWGYDGVGLYAPSNAYGTPDEFRRFVDLAHRHELAVILDVVYNHLGPEGNYLREFGPYLSSRHNTVWGDAPNFDDVQHGDAVRRWFIANAIYWLDEYRLDGLRVDAIHCMKDDRDPHIAAEISDAVRQWSDEARREVWLIAESNVYDPEMTVPTTRGGVGFDAMWSDDFLHGTFAFLRPGEQLCHREYRPTDMARVLQQGYVYEGTLRKERERTEPASRVDTSRLIYSIQNHDFIGNHPLGVRFHQLTSDETHRAAAALLLLSPAIPMLFMGEEFACEHPFRFFVDFSDEHLRESVVGGRRREYPQHDWEAGILPTDPAAFESAKIGPAQNGNTQTWCWYRDLIRLRKTLRGQGLLKNENVRVHTDVQQGVFAWTYEHGKSGVTVAVRLMPSDPIDSARPLEWPGIGKRWTKLADSRAIGGEPARIEAIELSPNHAVVIEHEPGFGPN